MRKAGLSHSLFLLFFVFFSAQQFSAQSLTPQERRREAEMLMSRGYVFSMAEIDELKILSEEARLGGNPELALGLDFLVYAASQRPLYSGEDPQQRLLLTRQWEQEIQRRQDMRNRKAFRIASGISVATSLASFAGAYYFHAARQNSFQRYLGADPGSPRALSLERDYRSKEIGAYLLTAHGILFAYLATVFEYNTPPEPR